jgi:hypothetical protein
MRYMVIIGAILLVSEANDTPIPQDAARMEKRFGEGLEWNRRTLDVAHDNVGKKDPRWDKAAHEALDLYRKCEWSAAPWTILGTRAIDISMQRLN